MRHASIIIPAFNHHELTIQCIESLIRYTPTGVEIIVVDDCSQEREFLQLLDKAPKDVGLRTVNIIRSLANGGFAKACNNGANLVRGKTSVLIFLNNDTTVTQNWYRSLVESIDGNCGIAGSKLLYPKDKFSPIHNREVKKGTIQHAGILIGDDLVPYHVHQFQPSTTAEVKMTFPYVTGASLAIDRTLFEKLGGFDTIYKNGCEDLDLCLRVRALNSKVVYCPDSIAFHHETATRSPEVAKTNLDLFTTKHRIKLEEDRHFATEEI